MSPDDGAIRRLKRLATLGNVVEWYDFGVFGYLSVALGKAFYPADDPTLQLVKVFATFGVSFLMRPVGAIIFGRLGDTIGRLHALSLTITLMGLSSLAMAFLPTYAQIGAWASVALWAIRLLQGTCVGGEYGGSVAALYEQDSESTRTKSASLSATTTILGLLLGSVAAAGANSLLGTAVVEAWGWRALFLVGGVAAVAIGVARAYPGRQTDAPPARSDGPASAWSIGLFWQKRWVLFRMTGMMALQSVAFYLIFITIPSVAANPQSALWVNSLAMAWLVVASHLVASLTESIDPVRLHSIAAALYIPVGVLLVGRTFSSMFGLMVAQLALATLHASVISPTPGILADAFPRHIRHTGVAFVYNCGVAIFGGSAPIVLVKLRDLRPGINWAAALVAFGGVVTLISLAAEWRFRTLSGSPAAVDRNRRARDVTGLVAGEED